MDSAPRLDHQATRRTVRTVRPQARNLAMYLIVFFNFMDGGSQNGRASADDTAAASEDAAADMTTGGYIRVAGEESF